MNTDEDELIQKLRERQVDPRRYIDDPIAFPHEVYPPVTLSELEEAERRLGFSLPNLLRRAYLEVGNGGFGPGFGILALNEHGARNFDQPLVDWYLDAIGYSGLDFPQWPRQYITICDWGDNITSILDWSDPLATIYRFNGDLYDEGPIESVIRIEAPSFRDWLEDWVAGISLFRRGRPPEE